MTLEEEKEFHIVVNNETQERKPFHSIGEAIKYQEYLIFECGIDAEVE